MKSLFLIKSITFSSLSKNALNIYLQKGELSVVRRSAFLISMTLFPFFGVLQKDAPKLGERKIVPTLRLSHELCTSVNDDRRAVSACLFYHLTPICGTSKHTCTLISRIYQIVITPCFCFPQIGSLKLENCFRSVTKFHVVLQILEESLLIYEIELKCPKVELFIQCIR